MNVLLWFKRDLRVHDHPALAMAARLGRVLPLYVVEPEYWRLPDTSARQWSFTEECLTDLRRDLALIGSPLVVRTGDAVAVMGRLVRQYKITQLVSHEETGNLWTYARDRRVAGMARDAGVEWIELPQSGVVRRLSGRDGWAKRRDAFIACEPIAAPATLQGFDGLEPGPMPVPCACHRTDARTVRPGGAIRLWP